MKKGRYRNAKVVRAAGGVVLHAGIDGDTQASQVLVVHRPRHNDWSLPKGHLESGETWAQAALREVTEETGIATELVEAAHPYPVSYLIGSAERSSAPRTAAEANLGRPKIVMFYLMRCATNSPASNSPASTASADPPPEPPTPTPDGKEVDIAQWWSLAEAAERLSYEVERQAVATLTEYRL